VATGATTFNMKIAAQLEMSSTSFGVLSKIPSLSQPRALSTQAPNMVAGRQHWDLKTAMFFQVQSGARMGMGLDQHPFRPYGAGPGL
jgi:hypothetical protein